MITKFEILYSWIMFPVYAWQGSKVRANTPRMDPPITTGVVSLKSTFKTTEKTKTQKQELRILLIGDSSAAGVGVDTIEQSLGGHLCRLLHDTTKLNVSVRIAGNNSATANQLRDYVVPHIEHEHFDFIALNVGTNDAKNFHRGSTFCKNFGTLLYALKSKFPAAQIIWSGIIDLEELEMLPKPLNKILGIRSRILNHNGQILCAERGALAPGNKEWKVITENFSKDGFHASSLGYERWAQGIADYIISLNTNHKQT